MLNRLLYHQRYITNVTSPMLPHQRYMQCTKAGDVGVTAIGCQG